MPSPSTNCALATAGHSSFSLHASWFTRHSPELGIVTQVMEPYTAIGCPLDAGDFQRIMECSAECGNGIPTSARAGEQRCVREPSPKVLLRRGAAINDVLNQIRCERHHPRFVELAAIDMQGGGIEIEVVLRKSQ
jgi:hypothetical protein